MTRNAILAGALLWTLATAAPVHADGPGAYRPPPKSAKPVLSEEQAIEAYNLGYAAIQRADHATALAEATADPKEKQTSQRAATEQYKQSLRHFEEAVRLDAYMYEALTYLGYANRRLGRHEQALDAYEHALKLNADYSYAIEYQGQAYLGLNRIDEARFNYLRLYGLNKGQAKKLLTAMQAWLNAPHAGIEVDEFAAWVAQRAELTRDDPIAAPW
ncbi:MAG: tetratricopeptide repeat protein [Steroidobacter sp.]